VEVFVGLAPEPILNVSTVFVVVLLLVQERTAEAMGVQDLVELARERINV